MQQLQHKSITFDFFVCFWIRLNAGEFLFLFRLAGKTTSDNSQMINISNLYVLQIDPFNIVK